MSGIVNKPLALFRRPESPRPLHARWGDVDISVPTEGSWNQYNNPHRPAQEERQMYGPGFVPQDRPSSRADTSYTEHSQQEISAGRSARSATSVPRRNSLSMGALRTGRLSVRLASRPKHLRGEAQPERDAPQQEAQRTDFAYKPIRQDYTVEATEKPKPAGTTSFKYIPTNGRYLEEIPAAAPPAVSLRCPTAALTVGETRSLSRWMNDSPGVARTRKTIVAAFAPALVTARIVQARDGTMTCRDDVLLLSFRLTGEGVR
ncbi:hypothetical protein N7507_005807 [Penicillium longicatenatum]|nr:hypothetical protein N7507_005807 [Penicillium longicatenatum]